MDFIPLDKQYETFLENQNKIYQKFPDSRPTVFADGFNKHKFSGKGAYMIAFVHPSDVSERVEELSRGISKIVPSMVYSAPNVHTTISDYDGPREGFEPDEDILKKLSLGLKRAVMMNKPIINYQGMVCNQDTAILRGYPSISFLEIASLVSGDTKDQGIELRMPWGAHMTCGRINDRITNQDKVRELLNYVDSSRVSFISVPKYVIVGHGLFSPDGRLFELNKFEEYKLQ